MNEKIELLNRNIARHDVIIALINKKIKCDEDLIPCDVCLGIDFAIAVVKEQMENENQ